MKPPDFSRTVFLDRSFGGYRLANLLRKVGFTVEVHKDHFRQDEDDHVWIPDVVQRGWVIFSSDGRLAKDPLNIHAVLHSKAQVLITKKNDTLPEVWGACFIAGFARIRELLAQNPGPVYIRIRKDASDHIALAAQHLYTQYPKSSIGSSNATKSQADMFPFLKF